MSKYYLKKKKRMIVFNFRTAHNGCVSLIKTILKRMMNRPVIEQNCLERVIDINYQDLTRKRRFKSYINKDIRPAANFGSLSLRMQLNY